MVELEIYVNSVNPCGQPNLCQNNGDYQWYDAIMSETSYLMVECLNF